MAPRPCPMILNDYTLAQPKIDGNNRYRQNILAIEKAIHTDAWPMRILTSLWGMEYVDAFRINTYFNGDTRRFKMQMRELSFKLLTNNWDETHGLDGVSLTRTGIRVMTGPGAPGGKSPERISPRTLAKKHVLVAIAFVEGWKGAHQPSTPACRTRSRRPCARRVSQNPRPATALIVPRIARAQVDSRLRGRVWRGLVRQLCPCLPQESGPRGGQAQGARGLRLPGLPWRDHQGQEGQDRPDARARVPRQVRRACRVPNAAAAQRMILLPPRLSHRARVCLCCPRRMCESCWSKLEPDETTGVTHCPLCRKPSPTAHPFAVPGVIC